MGRSVNVGSACRGASAGLNTPYRAPVALRTIEPEEEKDMIFKRARIGIVMACLVTLPAAVVFAQTRIKPGFNLFSVDQEQETHLSSLSLSSLRRMRPRAIDVCSRR